MFLVLTSWRNMLLSGGLVVDSQEEQMSIYRFGNFDS